MNDPAMLGVKAMMEVEEKKKKSRAEGGTYTPNDDPGHDDKRLDASGGVDHELLALLNDKSGVLFQQQQDKLAREAAMADPEFFARRPKGAHVMNAHGDVFMRYVCVCVCVCVCV